MADEMKRCRSCRGRGYFPCDCWPGDCICSEGDEPCEDCDGHGWVPKDDDSYNLCVECNAIVGPNEAICVTCFQSHAEAARQEPPA